ISPEQRLTTPRIIRALYQTDPAYARRLRGRSCRSQCEQGPVRAIARNLSKHVRRVQWPYRTASGPREHAPNRPRGLQSLNDRALDYARICAAIALTVTRLRQNVPA